MPRTARSNVQMLSFFWLLIIASGIPTLICAQDAPEKLSWQVMAECQMVVLPQKAALPLIHELNDESKIDAAFARIQEMITREEATLVANLVVKGRAGEMLRSDSIEEIRYPTDYNPPDLPD